MRKSMPWMLAGILGLWALTAGAIPIDGAATVQLHNEIFQSLSTKPGDGPLLGTDDYPVPIFLRGSFNDWSTANELFFGGDVYATSIDLDVGLWEFKIASDDWSTVDLGSGGADPAVSVGAPYVMGGGAFGNLFLDIDVAGTYSFMLDTMSGSSTPTLLVSSLMSVREPGSLALIGLALIGFVLARQIHPNR